MNDYNTMVEKELSGHILDRLGDYIGTNTSELHHELFNTDYYIIGYYQAEKWLNDVADGVFDAIRVVNEYEENNFGNGMISGPKSSESVVNMYTYIVGESLLSEMLGDNYNTELTQELCDEIREENSYS